MTNGRPNENNAERNGGDGFGVVPAVLSMVRTFSMPVALRGRQGAVKQAQSL